MPRYQPKTKLVNDLTASVGVAGVQGLAEVTFYSKWRLGEVERCVLRLLAAARRKLHGGTSDPYQVCPSTNCWVLDTLLAGTKTHGKRSAHFIMGIMTPCRRSSRCKSQHSDGQTTTQTPQTSGGELSLLHSSTLTQSHIHLPCMTAAWPLCRIFSSERGPEGKRCFIATTLEGFWKRYRDMLPQHRHCYEIIRHGYPCHLYFGAATC